MSKDYTSIICEAHNRRVHRREHGGAVVCYTRAAGLFLHSRDWRAIYPYAIINYNEDVYAADETKRFLYHLVCDDCQWAFQRDRKNFNSRSKGLKLKIELNDSGTPFVEGREVSIERLEAMLLAARKKQPSVDVTIVIPANLPIKYHRSMKHLVSRAEITFFNIKITPKVNRSNKCDRTFSCIQPLTTRRIDNDGTSPRDRTRRFDLCALWSSE